MNFYYRTGTLKSNKIDETNVHPKMPSNEENLNITSDKCDLEDNQVGNDKITSQSVEKKLEQSSNL